MSVATERLRLPFTRPNVLDLAPFYAVLRREAPVAPVTTPAGDPAWLVTRFDEVRDLLGDKRLGRSHPEPERASRITSAAIMDGPTGTYATEEADHVRMRRLLTPAFSAKRMQMLSGHVRDLVDGCVDQLLTAHADSPDGVVDLHAGLAFPLPVAVICRLLGVSEDDHEYFASLSERMANYAIGDDAHRARDEFNQYMTGLAEAKRERPGEDVISDLVRAQSTDPDYDYDEMIRLCVGLLRYAHTDLDVAGVTIRRGDAVILSINAANRDTTAFADAETFDPDREERGHLGFGHGVHFCIGASLARVELRVVFATLARRLPGLRLAKPLDELEVRTTLTGGVTELPVTW